ncbi:hypothetical protein GobsT_44530 [Gemmata obscuriglobus]|uniref:Uncharacterized protein n=1 Tax=Gemmata obscuriglobus TaxID=114 RepID=A0A2Z3GT41_9BACT|nr:hypothetical protein [Gemmata obscuriglobus]AWM37559.1 hypothetical protein C1280_11425 [Gemmata obscuriglobus]QEG29655.1 hypothetical protein GobsT_44530 [Gemmata obscuriglobus]VTS08972.1 unnamed protein product [Gemmata obscuriglobus UQM 2246]
MNPMWFLIAAAPLTCAAPVPKDAAAPPFAVVSVSYTDKDDRPQTAPFAQAEAVPPREEPPGKLRVHIGASAAGHAIVISGTGAQGRPAVQAIRVVLPGLDGGKEEVVSVSPKYAGGKWSATIEANTLPTNRVYRLEFEGRWAVGAAPDVELAIAANH